MKLSIIIILHGLFLLACDSGSHGANKRPQVQVVQQKSIYAEHGELKRLSSFNQTYFSPTYGLVSLAFYLDFSSGASQQIQELFVHEKQQRIPLQGFFGLSHVFAIGPPLHDQLPVLVGMPIDLCQLDIGNACYKDVRLAILNLGKMEIETEIPLSNEFYRTNLDFYHQDLSPEQIKSLEGTQLFMTPPAIHIPFNRPIVEFLSQSRLNILFPILGGLNHYDINLDTAKVKESLVLPPQNDFAMPFYFTHKLIPPKEESRLSFVHKPYRDYSILSPHQQKILPAQKITSVELQILPSGDFSILDNSPLRKANQDLKPHITNFRTYANQGWSVETWVHPSKLNQFLGELRIIRQGKIHSILEINSSYFSLDWAELYNSRFLLMAGSHGEEHASTFSLIKPGSIFLIALDLQEKRIVLQSEFYSGNEHQFVNAGLIDQQLWMAINHNWGGNHDGDTVRRTTTGRVFEIHLPKVIAPYTALNFTSSEGKFRPFSGKITIKTIPRSDL